MSKKAKYPVHKLRFGVRCDEKGCVSHRMEISILVVIRLICSNSNYSYRIRGIHDSVDDMISHLIKEVNIPSS